MREQLIENYTRNILFNQESIVNDFVYVYKDEENVLSVKKYIGSKSKIEVPDYFDEIGERAFMNTSIESVYLSENIQHIKKDAFSHSNLKSINLEKVKYLSESCFEDTELIGSIDISNVSCIDKSVFALTLIKDIKFADFVHLSAYSFSRTYIDNLYFNSVYVEQNAFYKSLIKEIIINGDILMEEEAFNCATQLKKICSIKSINNKKVSI